MFFVTWQPENSLENYYTVSSSEHPSRSIGHQELGPVTLDVQDVVAFCHVRSPSGCLVAGSTASRLLGRPWCGEALLHRTNSTRKRFASAACTSLRSGDDRPPHTHRPHGGPAQDDHEEERGQGQPVDESALVPSTQFCNQVRPGLRDRVHQAAITPCSISCWLGPPASHGDHWHFDRSLAKPATTRRKALAKRCRHNRLLDPLP